MKRISPRFADGPLLRALLDAPPPLSRERIFPFDIVGSVADLLSDKVPHDAGENSHDVHGRLRYESSFQFLHGVGELPLVDLYAEHFTSWIESVPHPARIPLWPEGKKCAVALTHDIDTPERFALLKTPWWPSGKSLRSNLGLFFDKAKMLRQMIWHKDPDDFWLFDDILRVESSRGLRSSFYFSVTPFHHPAGTPWDVHYDATGTRYREIMARLLDAGDEVGLHAGYSAYRSPATRFHQEKDKLERILGRPVEGLRHHYWMLGPDPDATLFAHEAAGFSYDSSIGFNDHTGYRRNTATPFHPFNEHAEREICPLQIPVFCMDGNLFYRPGPYDDRLREVRNHVERIKRVGGGAALLWHDRACFPRSDEFRHWGRAYIDILDGLANDRQIWVATPVEITRWLKARRKRLEIIQ